MRINAFVWPEDRIEHIARHGVTPGEMEEVCFGKSWVRRAKSEGANPVYSIPKMENPIEKPKLPKTDSIQELAAFWDAHDVTDFEHELHEVKEPVFMRGTAINVPLELFQVEAVERLARAKGVSREDLIRAWIVQKLARRNNTRPNKHG
jgi:hypothetical protein